MASPYHKGRCRICRPRPMEDDAVVEDINSGEPGGRTETIVPESVYRAKGYEPPFEDLKDCKE